MRRPYLFPLLLAALLAAPVAFAGDAISAAEQRLFADPHLGNLPAAATLRYSYRKNEAGQAAVDDEVILTAHEEGARRRVVQVDYLHGERHLALPEVEQAINNPVILYFLESDVRAMRRRLGGQENYFRRRIRLALAEHAQLDAVSFSYAGKPAQGTRVVVQPYVDDAQQERFQGLARKSYVFTLSEQVPGGVYELRTVVDDPAAAGKPLVEEILTLRGDKL